MPSRKIGLLLSVCFGLAVPFAGARAAAVCTAAEAAAAEIPAPTGELTLDAALEAVRSAAPEVRTSALEAAAMRFEQTQAGLRTNPALVTDSEQGELGAGETTFLLSQTFRLGNKRRLEARAAAARAAAAEADRNVILLQTELEAARVFHELAAAAEAARLAHETADIARMFADAVERRVDVGEASPTELARATVSAAGARAAAEQAAAEVAALRFELASLWGSESAAFDSPRVDMETPVELAAQTGPAELIESHPALSAARSAEEARRAEQRFARSRAYPDLTIGLGVKAFDDLRDDQVVASFSLPLPLFDRNQGAADAAAMRRTRAGVEAAALRARLVARLNQAVARVEGAERRRAALVDDALPAAREAERAVRVGYQAGEFDLTTTLDARNEWVATQANALAAALDARVAAVEARALAGLAPFSTQRCTDSAR